MKKFFKKINKGPHTQAKELAIFCGSVALLLLVAAFIANGGMGKVNNLLVANHIAPVSQAACGFFSACTVPVYIYTFTATPNPVVSGGYTSMNWSTYDADNCVLTNTSCVPGQAAYYDQVCSGYACDKWGNNCMCNQWTDGAYHPATASYNCGLNMPAYPWGQQQNFPGGSGPYSIGPITMPTTFSLQCFNGGSASTGASSPTYLTVTLGCPAGYTGTPPACVAPAPNPTLTINAGAGNGVTRAVTVGTAVTINTTVTPGAGDTVTRSSIVDSAFNAVPGISTAVPPTSKSYVFTPAGIGSYVFYPSVQTTAHPAWSNYGKSVTIVASAAGPCNDIPAQPAVPTGCVTPVPAPGTCTPTGGSYSASSNTCSCPAGKHLSGTACVANPLCSNGLADSYAPSCTCPSGQYQPPGGTSCAALPICANGLGPAYSPSCTCPAGQIQVSGGTTCVLQGSINSLTASPSRVLKGNAVTLTWSTSHMTSCNLSGFNNTGHSSLSSAPSASVSPVVSSKTIYTLACSDASGASYSSSVTVNLIPQTKEQ